MYEDSQPAAPTPPDVEVSDILDGWVESVEEFAYSFDIPNKDAQVVPFVASQPQRTVFADLAQHRRYMILKGRQMWITTAVVVWALRFCLLRPGSRVCVAAHSDKAATEISAFYLLLYNHNALLRTQMPLKGKGREHKLQFENGSRILFGTANSEFWRGFPTHLAHLTEASQYDNLSRTLASLGNTVPQNGQMVIETTANGENAFHSMWTDPHITFAKRFLCWLDHLEYRLDRELPQNLTEIEAEYIRKYELTREQAAWWVDKRRGQPANERYLMDQEFPPTPEVAFLLSGQRFLLRKVAEVAKESQKQPDEQGIIRLFKYDDTHQYCAGVDVATGLQTGDASTLIIGDVTDKKVVLTLQIRLPTPEFAPLVRKVLAEYGDPVTNVELQQGGLDVCDYLRRNGVPIYLMPDFGGLVTTLKGQHGWTTTETTRMILYGAIYDASTGADRWQIGCQRTVAELNALCYDKRKRPAAPWNGYDDLAVGLGLMALAVPQAHPPAKAKAKDTKPPTLIERLEAQLAEHENDKGEWFSTGGDVKAGDFFD